MFSTSTPAHVTTPCVQSKKLLAHNFSSSLPSSLPSSSPSKNKHTLNYLEVSIIIIIIIIDNFLQKSRMSQISFQCVISSSSFERKSSLQLQSPFSVVIFTCFGVKHQSGIHRSQHAWKRPGNFLPGRASIHASHYNIGALKIHVCILTGFTTCCKRWGQVMNKHSAEKIIDLLWS